MWISSKAQKNVTNTTIINCFKKCGFKVDLADPTDEELEEVGEELVTAEGNKTPTGWTEVTQALNIDQLEFEEFVAFDNDVAVCGELSDADIITSVSKDSTVHSSDEEGGEADVEGEPTQSEPTVNDARAAIDVLRQVFLKKCVMNESVVNSINELDTALDNILTQGKQSKIDDFFNPVSLN